MVLSFAIIGSIAATALKFINNARKAENRTFIFESEKVEQLALSLEYNTIPKIPKDDLLSLLNVATKQSFFMFNNEFYKQVDGIALGSPLGPALAYILMCSFENKWLKDCPHGLKPVFYRRYVNDIFLLFSLLDHAKRFKNVCLSNIPT